MHKWNYDVLKATNEDQNNTTVANKSEWILITHGVSDSE